MSFRQGDVVWVNLPFTDGSGSKKRPALVVSGERVNQNGEYILIQITSKKHGDEFTIALEPHNYSEKPLGIDSYLRVHKIFILNEALISGRAARLSVKAVEAIKSRFIELIF